MKQTIREVEVTTIKNEVSAYFFCEWFTEKFQGDQFQGWDLVRSETDGKIWQLRYGNLSHLVDMAWAWNNRKNINEYIRTHLA
jgi:hypothetical protein